MSRRMLHPHGIFSLFIALLSYLVHVVYANSSSPTPTAKPTTALSNPISHTPLLMLSTIDGTVSAFDARTGATVFTHSDTRPAIETWAAPGVESYIPGLDGVLYRIDKDSGVAHIVEGKFVNTRTTDASVVPAQNVESGADAVILTWENSSMLYIDLRTGRVIKEIGTMHPPKSDDVFPQMSENVVVVVRTSVGVRVKNANTAEEVANATLVHTNPMFLENGRCRSGSGDDKYVAHVSATRDLITVRDEGGEVLWSKQVTATVVEAHGIGGVKIAEDSQMEELGESNTMALGGDVVVREGGGSPYAMLAGPDDDGKRYKVGGNRDPRKVSSEDRVLGSKRWMGLPTRKLREEEKKNDLGKWEITSREAGLAGVAMIFMGILGYMAGRRPRKQRRPRRSRQESRPVEQPEVEREEEEEEEAEDDLSPRRYVLTGREEGIVSSNGSTGSGGFISNRTQSGWMTVGCLRVSSKVLGVGSHGTVVYEGKIMPGDRKVAVKRLLRQFFESARKEISLLVELDEASPHVVRYFAMEEDSEFIYLALELCAGSLAERVQEKMPPVPPPDYVSGPPPVCTSRALRQLLQGLADLHRAGVVHRDVKPQNVLITRATSGQGDVKLADVGLALRLAANRSSYTAVTNAGGGVGTTGWRAPEVLSGGRQTKAVDIFAAGCVVCFVITGGNHPFGNAIFGRDGNIAAGKPSLEALEALELPEATDIVKKMIDPVASQRPSAEEALSHPFFWTDAMKLAFLVDISDRLYDTRHNPARFTENLDRYPRAREYCSDWLVRMDMELLKGLGRGYENTASGLLRVIRNKRNHYSELPLSLHKLLGPLPEEKQEEEDQEKVGRNFLTYFTSKVPELLMCVYYYAIENPVLIDQPHFLRYGLKPDTSRVPLTIHPLVLKMRAERTDGIVTSEAVREEQQDEANVDREEGPEQTSSTEDSQLDGTLEAEEEASEEEVVVTTRPNRRAYHRHELVALQASCYDMYPELIKRTRTLEIYQPSAYARYRKRLATNTFEDADFEAPPQREAPQIPPGFQRVPNRQTPGPPGFGTRSTYMASSPSRPPGFGTSPGHRRNGNTIAPTVSQFSGEQRVVDFSSLRRRK